MKKIFVIAAIAFIAIAPMVTNATVKPCKGNGWYHPETWSCSCTVDGCQVAECGCD